MEKYRRAVENRDVSTLMGMTSRFYFDDMGTPAGEDDVDYDTLKLGLERMRKEVLAARYQISYRGLTYTENARVLVDLLYTGWFKVQTRGRTAVAPAPGAAPHRARARRRQAADPLGHVGRGAPRARRTAHVLIFDH